MNGWYVWLTTPGTALIKLQGQIGHYNNSNIWIPYKEENEKLI